MSSQIQFLGVNLVNDNFFMLLQILKQSDNYFMEIMHFKDLEDTVSFGCKCRGVSNHI